MKSLTKFRFLRQFVHRVLNNLLDSDTIEKLGKAPKTSNKIRGTSLVSKVNYGEILSSKTDF